MSLPCSNASFSLPIMSSFICAVRVTPSIPRMNCLISLGLLHGSVESGVKTISATSHRVSIILCVIPRGSVNLAGDSSAC